VIDFIRSLRAPDADLDTLFDHSSADSQMILDLLRNERVSFVSGHYGNWEVGAVFIRRIVKIPFAIIAMAEDNPLSTGCVTKFARRSAPTRSRSVNRSRRRYIRRRLAANGSLPCSWTAMSAAIVSTSRCSAAVPRF
jgi:hypothetical protein